MFLKFGFRRFFNSFRFALRGIKIIFQKEQSFAIQCLAAIIVGFLMFYFDLTVFEKLALVLIIILILVLEILNTATERILNILEPNYNEQIGMIKDLISAAVLVASLGSAVVGILIFGQRILNFFGYFN